MRRLLRLPYRWLIFQTLHTRYQTLPYSSVQPVQRLLFVLLDKTLFTV